MSMSTNADTLNNSSDENQPSRKRIELNYLATFLVGIVVSLFLVDVGTQEPFFKGQSLSIVVTMVLGLVGFIQWIFFKPRRKRDLLTSAFLLAFLLFWIFLYLRAEIDGTGVNYTVYLVPLLLVMLFIKPLTQVEVRAAADIFAWAIVIMIVVSEVIAIFNGYRGLGSVLIRVPFLPDSVGGVDRWVGPFGNPNYAGPIGAYLLIYGIYRAGITRAVLITAGLAILVLSGSRSAMFGVVAGLSVYFIYSQNIQLLRLPRKARVAIVAVIAVALVIISNLADPTFNGRTPIWAQYWEWFKDQTFSGHGTNEINNEIASGAIPPWMVHAHDIFLDQAGRNGLLGIVLLLALMIIALVCTIKAAGSGASVGLALVAAFIVIGLVEVPEAWIAWCIPLAFLLVSILLCFVKPQKTDDSSG
jgi:O-antigen ligase